ncbi:MAG: radical SAM protein [Syntrophorhabdales bacterium]|jgi:radical SAM superfamily enzyme YgiQ (UPF0313 family)
MFHVKQSLVHPQAGTRSPPPTAKPPEPPPHEKEGANGRRNRIRVLLVNPYIYDVSAYSFWSAPLGLLQIGAILRENGMDVSLLDCLKEREDRRKEDGRAPYVKQRVDNPEPARTIKRRFKRYGISPEEVRARLSGMTAPDLVLVTCVMTYWYQGAREIVRIVRDVFPRARIVVGGIYASLCHDHAKRVMEGADLVVRNSDLGRFYTFLEDVFSSRLALKPEQGEIDAFPLPAFDLYDDRHFVPLLTSFGCAYRCTYCASPYLYPRPVRRDVRAVLGEIAHWADRGISRFALYDDAFLFRAEAFAKPLLLGMARLPFETSLYNPNALNATLIDGEIADLLREARFREVRLGLETVDPAVQRATGGKVTQQAFERAVGLLSRAGFPRGSIQAYVLAGLPQQRHEDVRRTVDFASGLDVRVTLAAYTPIPHTEMFETYCSLARYPIVDEPLFQNNALFPFAWQGFTEEHLNELKLRVREINGAI